MLLTVLGGGATMKSKALTASSNLQGGIALLAGLLKVIRDDRLEVHRAAFQQGDGFRVDMGIAEDGLCPKLADLHVPNLKRDRVARASNKYNPASRARELGMSCAIA